MRHRIWISAVQLTGLVATGGLVWFLSIAPRLRHRSLGGIATDALLYSTVAFLWAAALTLLLSLALGRDSRRRALALAMPTARTAVWFAPASILLAQRSAAALVPAIALVVGTTEILYVKWIEGEPDQRSSASFAVSLAAAFAFEGGCAALLLGRPVAAAFLFSIAAALLTFLIFAGGLLEPGRTSTSPQSSFGVALTIILAAGLTTVQTYYHYRHGSGETNRDETPTEEPGENDTPVTGEVFPGVILRPPVKPYAVLVAPRPHWTSGSLSATIVWPFSIPFSGEYWLYRPPRTHPPDGAVRQTGDPTRLGFRTTDHAPLTMEARQGLDHLLDLSCCRAIGVAIANRDHNPGTISLELMVSDTRTRPDRSMSLGVEKVSAWPDPKSDAPANETLEYPVPGHPLFRVVTALNVIMHRDPVRRDRSARISIDRFILVPVGSK
jgi:hypothetical protein